MAIQATPERISEISLKLIDRMGEYLSRIEAINLQARLLSFNARIEAVKAGNAGKTFSVVASEMGTLSRQTASVADSLAKESKETLSELYDISQRLSTDVRGRRLSDLAHTNIELIDRNLYERSCDVRWWATDASVVEAAANPNNPEILRFTSSRLATILKAYTVYYDIVVANLEGKILTNGRPADYRSIGLDVSKNEWFQTALRTTSGDEFGFEGVHNSPLVNGKRILAYSCGIRQNGNSYGELLGILGILFNWDSLALTIVDQTPLADDEKAAARVCIVDLQGRILADTKRASTRDTLPFVRELDILQTKRGYKIIEYQGKRHLVAYGFSPGYETYSTGWCGLIMLEINKN
ncbi:MAG: cache domain-containing protein [Chthoniobacterales bacterium]|nr:cache domain-containing protein [Chthoniobacterales bacterium]